jgi:NAD(P)H-hydrate epimerase
MKVLSAEEMARIEQVAYQKGASEEEFMEAAGRGIAKAVEAFAFRHRLDWVITLLCGKGNNAGDTYVAGRMLRSSGFHVQAIQLAHFDSCSSLCRRHMAQFEEEGGEIIRVSSPSEITFPDRGLILDGVFGTGFRGTPQGLFAAGIEKANASDLPIIAVDTPSGINGSTGEVATPAIHASATVALGFPKTGLFITEGWNHVGEFTCVNFGIDPKIGASATAQFELATEEEICTLLPPLVRNRHKYEAGYVVGWAGSPLMPGAAILAGTSALRSGAGIVRIVHAPGVQLHQCGAPPELLDQSIESIDSSLWERAKALFAGPGIGVNSSSTTLLKELLQKSDRPLVLDADALTILAQEKLTFPKETILTPHHGEMQRLLNSQVLNSNVSGKHLLEATHKFSKQYSCVVLLKGSPTFLFSPQLFPTIIARGDPGMATAGSGDVLTGVVAALLAQGLQAHHAALLGAMVHAIAGELAAQKLSSYAMSASDIMNELPNAFLRLQRLKETL